MIRHQLDYDSIDALVRISSAVAVTARVQPHLCNADLQYASGIGKQFNPYISWSSSDTTFSLMDNIACGLRKMPVEPQMELTKFVSLELLDIVHTLELGCAILVYS